MGCHLIVSLVVVSFINAICCSTELTNYILKSTSGGIGWSEVASDTPLLQFWGINVIFG